MSQEIMKSESAPPSIGRIVRMKEHCCLRCGHLWIARDPHHVPLTCANKKCRSPLWNTPRAYAKAGKPTPTRKGKPRGRSARKIETLSSTQ